MMATDPFTLSIIRNGLISAAEEMFTVTARSAQSPIIYDVLDFSTAITDSEGNVTAQATGIPLFIGVFDFMVKGVIEYFGYDKIQQGDVIILNDPYISGTHLNDVGVVSPIFYNNKLIGFSASKGHWLDVGGMTFGSWGPGRTEIYQEGIQIPPCKLYNKGQPNTDVISIIKTNSRMPKTLVGDMEAQVAGLRIAEKRVLRIAEKYGISAYTEAVERTIEDGKKIAIKRLSEIPNGKFHSEDYMDEGGENDEPLPIQVDVKIDRTEFVVDFSKNSKQLPFSLNTTYPATVAAVRVVYMSLIDPHARYNQGIVSPLKVVAPEGTIFNARRPAPVSVYWEALTYAADLVWKALAPVVKDRLTAGHFLSVVAEIIAGIDDRSGEPFALVEPNPGGWGAGYDKDGETALVSFADGETYASSVEVIEIRYPIIVERYSINTEDGTGHGKFRGGFGIIKDYRITNSEAEFTTDINRSRIPPWGMDGGMSGTGNYIVVIKRSGATKVRKISSLKLEKSDVISIRTGAGGGWGDPLERQPELVLNDVINELIDVETAKRIYGVIVDKERRELKLEETVNLRTSLRNSRK
jgi:N-methylhydantoinase B